MKFIALKTKDGELKGDIAFFCRVLHVSRQGFYQYLANKGCPWKYQAETVSFIVDCLDPVRTFSAEEEQGIAVRIKLKAVLDDIDQTVQLFSHIGVPGAQTDLFHPGEVA